MQVVDAWAENWLEWNGRLGGRQIVLKVDGRWTEHSLITDAYERLWCYFGITQWQVVGNGRFLRLRGTIPNPEAVYGELILLFKERGLESCSEFKILHGPEPTVAALEAKAA